MEHSTFTQYGLIIKDYAAKNYHTMFREAGGTLKRPFIVPGTAYPQQLWDWDSWLTDIAIRELSEEDISAYEQGCILNFLDHVGDDGWTPIMIEPERIAPPWDPSDVDGHQTNSHKPCLAQHAQFVLDNSSDRSWFEGRFGDLERYLSFYTEKSYHEPTGLYFWQDDTAIGIDNEPCTFYRPHKSTCSIYLNCLMYMEFSAAAHIAEIFDLNDKKAKYLSLASKLKKAINDNCWDERDGFYYSVDINLLPITSNFLHSGAPRHWSCLIQRIDVWTGFLAMWSGIASMEQAERMVKEHYLNEKTFYAPYGIRSLSKLEKMYAVKVSGNPSCWLGPIWGISNYMLFVALDKYGYKDLAAEMCEKTIEMLGLDIAHNGAMHEYFDPETGAGVHNLGFQSWNLLAVKMIKWYEKNILNIKE